MDGLDDDERILAWLASWAPSFTGKAIVNEDFTFRSANQQFCDILGVTHAEIIGKSVIDLTPEPVKSLDRKNAELVKKKVIQSYLLPKVYEFPDGKRVSVTLLMSGVYHKKTGQFMFFVSSIMERVTTNTLDVRSLKQGDILVKKTFWTIGTSIGLGIIYVIQKVLLK